MDHRQRYGPLNVAARMEWQLAYIGYVLCNALGVKKQGGAPFVLEDFLPYRKKPELTLETALGKLGLIINGKS